MGNFWFQNDGLGPGHRRGARGRGQFALRSRIRRGIVGCLLAVLLLIGSAYYYYTRPARLIEFAEAYLSTLVEGQVRIGDAAFSIFEGIRLYDVTISPIDAAGIYGVGFGSDGLSVFTCESLALKHDPIAALVGRLSISGITATRTHFAFVADPLTGSLNLGRMLRSESLSASTDVQGRGQWLASGPRVQLPDTTFSFYKIIDGQRHLQHEARIDLWAVQRRAGSPLYRIIWRDRHEMGHSGQARLNLQSGAFAFETGSEPPPWLPVEFAIAAIPITDSDVERWVRLLGIEGNLRIEDLTIGPQAGRLGASGRLRLRGATLSVPLTEDEQHLPSEERIFTLQQVEGVVTVTAATVHAEFVGDLRGRRCEATLDIHDVPRDLTLLSDAAWDLTISCAEFELLRNDPIAYPVEARAISLWPVAQRFYRDFDPHGRVRLRCHLSKDSGSQAKPRLVEGHFEALACDGLYRHFPYRLTEVTGAVEFTQAGGLRFLDLIGRHGPAIITVNGASESLSPRSKLRYVITGRSVPLDDDLRQALPESYRASWDLFDLSGLSEMVVTVERPPVPDGAHRKVHVVVEGELQNVRATYSGFAYPIEQLRGRFRIDDGLTLENVSGTQGSLKLGISGYSKVVVGQGRLMDLEIVGKSLALDDLLMRAFSPRVREVLEKLHLDGQADVTGRVFQTRDMSAPSFEFAAAVHSMSLAHEDLPYELTDGSAEVRIEPGRVEVRNFVAAHRSALVRADAEFGLAAEPTRVEMRLRASDVELDDTLWEALPSHVSKTASQFHPAGTVDVLAEYSRRSGSTPGSALYTIEVTTAGNEVRYDAFPLPLSDLTGKIVFTRGGIELIDLRASHAEALLRIGGNIRYDKTGFRARLELAADDLAFTPSLSGALPLALQNLWEELQPIGKFDLLIAPLVITRSKGQTPLTWSAEGTGHLQDVSLEVGLNLREASGDIFFESRSGEAPDGLMLEGSLSLDSASLGQARGQDITGQFIYDHAQRFFALRNLQADAYGGTVGASLLMSFGGEHPRYEVACELNGAQLNPLLRDRRHMSADEPFAVKGRLGAILQLSGLIGRSAARTGWGRVTVTDAQLYRLPMLLGILNVINLITPEEGAFQEGRFDFTLRGDHMRLDNIALEGSAVSLMGSGSMFMSTETLDVDLVVSSPRRALKVPIFTDLMVGAARELAEVKVTGPLTDPHISTRPLRGLARFLGWLVLPHKPQEHLNQTAPADPDRSRSPSL